MSAVAVTVRARMAGYDRSLGEAVGSAVFGVGILCAIASVVIGWRGPAS